MLRSYAFLNYRWLETWLLKTLCVRVYLTLTLRIWVTMKVKVAQSCLTLCNPLDYTVRGILQARILEWVAFPFSRGSSQPGEWTQVSRMAGGFLPAEPQWKPKNTEVGSLSPLPKNSNPGFLPDPGIKPESLSLQVDSLPTELRSHFERYSISKPCLEIQKGISGHNISQLCNFLLSLFLSQGLMVTFSHITVSLWNYQNMALYKFCLDLTLLPNPIR